MKKFKISILLLVLLFVGGLVGCKEKEAEENNDKEKPPTLVIEDTVEEKEKEEDTVEDPAEELVEGEKTVLKLSFPDAQYQKLETALVEVDSLEPQLILDELSQRGHLSGDVKVLDFTEETDEGAKLLNLDLNRAFADQLKNVGTSGESSYMGMVCNSFLDTYEADKIKITVEGKILESNHRDYPGYLEKY